MTMLQRQAQLDMKRAASAAADSSSSASARTDSTDSGDSGDSARGEDIGSDFDLSGCSSELEQNTGSMFPRPGIAICATYVRY